MAITQITYHCPTSSMGDNVTEQDADGYRAWIKECLIQEFPGADITVTAEQHTSNIETDAGIDDLDVRERVYWFVQDCWDRCGWEWVHS